MRDRDRFLADIVAQCPQQRHTLGRSERQVETVDRLGDERPPRDPVGGDPVIEPPASDIGISKSTIKRRTIQSHQCTDRGLVTGHQPGRHPGVALGVVLPQSAAGGLAIHRRRLSTGRGVVVIVHAPPRQPRDRQHV